MGWDALPEQQTGFNEAVESGVQFPLWPRHHRRDQYKRELAANG
jgi:hypothetical protein